MLKPFIQFLFFMLFALQLTSCITSRKINYLQEPDRKIPVYKDSLTYEDYHLRTGDRLMVKVYSTDEKTNAIFNGGSNNMSMMSGSGSSSGMDLYTYLVEQNGNIDFPMIGQVHLKGLTIREATDSLEKAIEPLFRFSTVEIRIINRNFSVIGGGKAGYYPIVREKINIFQALALAGDIDTYGDRGRIRIIRETDNGTQIKTFDVRSKDIIHSEFYYVEPNDVIYIQTLDEQFVSITTLPGLLSTVISTFSFGVLIYNYIFTK